MAAQFGHMDVISTLLLNSDGIAEIKDEGGWTAAQLAESEEQEEAQILLEDWASDEAGMRKRLEKDEVLKKAEASSKAVADSVRSQVEELVQEALRPIEEEMSAMRAEIDSLVDRCAPIPPHPRPALGCCRCSRRIWARVPSVAEVSAAAQAERGV